MSFIITGFYSITQNESDGSGILTLLDKKFETKVDEYNEVGYYYGSLSLSKDFKVYRINNAVPLDISENLFNSFSSLVTASVTGKCFVKEFTSKAGKPYLRASVVTFGGKKDEKCLSDVWVSAFVQKAAPFDGNIVTVTGNLSFADGEVKLSEEKLEAGCYRNTLQTFVIELDNTSANLAAFSGSGSPIDKKPKEIKIDDCEIVSIKPKASKKQSAPVEEVVENTTGETVEQPEAEAVLNGAVKKGSEVPF